LLFFYIYKKIKKKNKIKKEQYEINKNGTKINGSLKFKTKKRSTENEKVDRILGIGLIHRPVRWDE
jgi:hypothetical protein